MAQIKRVLVCFNKNNKSHADLLDKCLEEFGLNLSSGIRSVLWLYFNGSFNNSQPQQLSLKNGNEKENEKSLMGSVL